MTKMRDEIETESIMEKNIPSYRPYSTKIPPNEYGTNINLYYYYVFHKNTQPSVLEIRVPIKGQTINNLEKLGAKKFYTHNFEKLEKNKKTNTIAELCFEYKDAIISLSKKASILNNLDFGIEEEDEESEVDNNEYIVKILYLEEKTLKEIKKNIEYSLDVKQNSNIHLLCSMDGMLSTQKFDTKFPQEKIDIELNYGKEAADKYKKVSEYLGNNKNGLILFSGAPGTGKSTFIKYLSRETTRKIIYISSTAAEQLTSPDFLSFIMGQRNCILLLEDAEKALRSRETQDNEAISNILNVTDGILGDCLNILVIATFNTDREKIDSALLRKGRLILEHHFEPLSIENSNKLLKKLGVKKTTSVPMTLAEIYNNSEENYTKEKEEKRIGFSS